MNLNNFKSHINKTIVARGYNYYIEGNIVEAYEQGENKYIFHIEGSDEYRVVVELGDNGDILYSGCDCPYDFGPVCKHEVAAYYQLFELLNLRKENEKVMIKSNNRLTLQEVLHNLPKEELINIIVTITHNDPTFEKSLMVKYSSGDNQQELKACQVLIYSIVKKYTGRERFIKYRDTSDFVNELESVVEKARNTENVHLAMDIAMLLLEEAIGAFQYADDSGGDIGFLVTKTLELIEEMAANCNEMGKQREELFEKLLAQTDHKVFDGWENFQIDLLTICFEFADDETCRKELRIKIESMIDEKSTDRNMHYTYENLYQLLFRLIEQYGTAEEADQFIYEHLQFSSFREQLLNKYIQEKNYNKVIEVAKEGEESDQSYPGLISKWKKYRYEAYKLLSLKEEQQVLAKELLMGGDFEYYQDLKELAAENQDEFYENLKQELKMVKGWHKRRIFLKLIEEENDLEEMLEYVREHPSDIEDYAEKLIKHFKPEVIEIYKEFLNAAARTASNRREYQGVCKKIKNYKRFAGKPKQEELINELIELNSKSPAFLDELGKIK